nr:hypothetical protein [Exiguobacterium sp. AM39-5BH]
MPTPGSEFKLNVAPGKKSIRFLTFGMPIPFDCFKFGVGSKPMPLSAMRISMASSADWTDSMRRLTNQLQALITNSERLAVDPHATLIPIEPLQNEVGQLSKSFTEMSSSLIHQHDELEKEREKTARILHTMRDAIVFVETDTNKRFANEPLFELYEQPFPFGDRQSLYPIDAFYEPFMDQIDDQDGLNRFTHRAKNCGIFDETLRIRCKGEDVSYGCTPNRLNCRTNVSA